MKKVFIAALTLMSANAAAQYVQGSVTDPAEGKPFNGLGYSTRNSGGVIKKFRNYFVIVFDKAFDNSFTWKDGKEDSNSELTGKHTCPLFLLFFR